MSGVSNNIQNTVGTYYNTAVQNTPVAANAVSSTLQSMPTDTLALGSKSLLTGISISSQIVSARKSEIPSETTKFHSGASLVKTGRNAAIIGGLISTAQNTYDFIQGTITGSRAIGNTTSDVVGAVGSGILAAGTGSLASTMIGSTMGAGITGLIVGTAAFAGADFLYRNTGVYQSISDTVTTFIDNVLKRIKPTGGW